MTESETPEAGATADSQEETGSLVFERASFTSAEGSVIDRFVDANAAVAPEYEFSPSAVVSNPASVE